MPRDRVRHRSILMFSVITSAFVVIGWRFWDLQIAHGAAYQSLGRSDEWRDIALPASRGKIVTANGVTVAGTRPSWALYYLNPGTPMSASEAQRLAGDLQTSVSSLNALITQRLAHQPAYQPIEIDANLTPRQMTVIEGSQELLPHLRIQPIAVPYDPYGSLMGNILGYLDQNTATTYRGVYGLEQEYNHYLVGHSGREYAEVNREGQLIRLVGQDVPEPGDTIHLTINWNLEKTAYEALAYDMSVMRHANPALTGHAPQARQGGVLVMNPNNGDILAIASLPTYNPNRLLPGSADRTAYWDHLNARAQKTHTSPWTIVPIQDPFPPASTFKPIMSVAALASHIVTPTTEIYDPGYFPKIPSFHSWEYPDAFGWLNIEQAIGLSDDTFFYTLGYDMGIHLMDHWMAKFLLNKPTHIDLPGAITDQLPTPRELQRTQGVPWTPGQNLNTVVGQGLDDFTMVTLARADAAIANGGTLYEPHLVSEITAPDGRTIKRFGPVVQGHIDVPKMVWQTVHRGMELSAQDPDIAHTGTSGTGYGALAGFPIPLASKTGTAQVTGQANNAVFLTYGPMEGSHPHPTILIMVYVKGGNWGADSGFVARAIYDQYFKVADPTAQSLLDYTFGEPFAWPFGYHSPKKVVP